MRILHTSDWHLGRSFHREDLLGHQGVFVDHLLDVVERRAGRRRRGLRGRLRPGAAPRRRRAPRRRGVRPAGGVAGVGWSSPAATTTPPSASASAPASSTPSGVFIRTVGGHGRHPRPARGRARSGRDPRPALPRSPRPRASRGGCRPGRTRRRSTQAMLRVRADLAGRRPSTRSVVMAHAFVAGAEPSDSERDISVGGVSRVRHVVVRRDRLRRPRPPARPAHPHRVHPLQRLPAGLLLLRGRPPQGVAGSSTSTPTAWPTPSSSRLRCPAGWRASRGELEALLADPRLEVHERRLGAGDPHRPAARPRQAMDRLRARFPHTLVLGFAPPSGATRHDPGRPRRRSQRPRRRPRLRRRAARRPGDARRVGAAAPGRRRLLRGHRPRRAGG